MVRIYNSKGKINFLLTMIFLLPLLSWGQTDSQYHQKVVSYGDTLQVDSLTLIPSTLKIALLNGTLLDTSCFSILPDGRSVAFTQKKACIGDSTYSLLVSYRTFPYQLDKKWQHKDPGLVKKDQNVIGNPFLYVPSKSGNTDLFQLGAFSKEGSISRGLSFGNSQDVVVNSSMNLQLSGKLTDELDLLLSATDDNIPIQPDGTTAQLQEFDKIFIQVSDKNHKIIAGDFEMKRPESYFLNYYKKVQGLSYDYKWNTDNKLLGQKKGLLKASGAVSKGKFSRQVFNGTEGNQGPYRLRGSENELFIVILSGSEAVYIDGELMKRGMENDYVIDYNTAEIIFTPNQLITKDKRIVVEFQYSDKQFARSVYALGYDYEVKQKGKTYRVYAHGYSEQDAKNKPLQQTLSTEEKQLLAAVGDSVQNAFVYSIDSVPYTNTEVLYHKKDTIVGLYLFSDIYKYSTNPDSSHYRLSFSFVGAGKGNYNQITSSANGKVFEWIIPDTLTNTPRGTYEPVLLLVSPKKKQLISAGTLIQWSPWAKMSLEGSFSVNDINQFSKLDKLNDQGYAGKFQIELPLLIWKTKAKIPDGGYVGGLKIGAGYEFVHANFAPIERFRSIEFERDWNRINLAQKEDQHIIIGTLSWFRNKNTPLLYRYSTFLEGSTYEGFRHELITDVRNKKQKFVSNASWLEAAYGNYSSSFIRANANASQQLGGIILGVKGNFEENQLSYLGDSLLNTSFGFLEWEASIAAPDTAKITWKAAYKSRTDKNVLGKSLSPSTHADNYTLGLGFRKSKVHRVTVTGTYRILRILDSAISIHKPDESLLGRIEYELTLLNGVIVSSTFFEVGSGLEQKKEFTFIEVPAGQGIYTWIDHNGNDVKELNEFEIAAFPDQATYLKVFTPTQEYIRTYYNQFAQSLIIRPGLKWKKEKGIKKGISRFSNQTSFRGDRKSTEEDLLIAYNPFLQNVNEISLQTLNSSFRNTLWINQGSPNWAADGSWNDVRNKSLLTNGFDTRSNTYYEGNIRWNVSKKWSLSSQYKDGYKSLSSDFFASKNYHYHYYEIQPRINYQPDPTFRAALSYKYSEKINGADFGGQRAEIQNYGTEIRYNTLQKGSFTAKLNYIQIAYTGTNNGSISFEFLEGLNAGRNITWGLNFQRTLSNNLQVNLTYDARLPDGSKAVHTGGAQVRAFF